MYFPSSPVNALMLNSLDYTSPVFFWTNIEIAMGVISACLPTYRPIWLFFSNDPVTGKNSYQLSSYSRFGSSRFGRANGRFQNSLLDDEVDGLNQTSGVNTFVGTGTPGTRGPQDANMIAVEQDLYTNNE